MLSAGATATVSNTASQITYARASLSSSTTSDYYADDGLEEVNPSSSIATPSANTLPYNLDIYNDDGSSNSHYENKNTKKLILKICGGSHDKDTYQLTANSSTQYSYVGPAGGTGNRNYSANWVYAFAGWETSTTTGTSPSYTRTWDFSSTTNESCKKRNNRDTSLNMSLCYCAK